MKDGREKRAYPRVEMRIPVKYRVVADLNQVSLDRVVSEVVEQNSINMSAGGACIRTDEKLPQDAIVVLMFEIPGMGGPVKTVAKVAWCEEDAAIGFKVGLQYLLLSEEQVKLIEDRLRAAGGGTA